MQDLDLPSGQHYGMGYGYNQMPQFEISASASQSFTSTEYRDFEYYHLDADIVQQLPSYYSNDTSST